jgi:hypothetical protein
MFLIAAIISWLITIACWKSFLHDMHLTAYYEYSANNTSLLEQSPYPSIILFFILVIVLLTLNYGIIKANNETEYLRQAAFYSKNTELYWEKTKSPANVINVILWLTHTIFFNPIPIVRNFTMYWGFICLHGVSGAITSITMLFFWFIKIFI